MKCHQCDRPALYEHENKVMLCLSCHSKIEDLRLRQNDQRFREMLLNAAMLNQATDDLEAVAPWAGTTSRIPVESIAATARGNTMNNHIAINDSSIGVLNTGDLAKINAVVTITGGTDVEELGQSIKDLTQSILDSNEVLKEDKVELVELLASLTEQVTIRRSKPVMKTILSGIEEKVRSINSIWGLCEKVMTLVEKLN